MNKKISLRIPKFIPANPEQDFLNLDEDIPLSLNQLSNPVFESLKQISLRKLVGIRQNKMEIELKNELRKFLGRSNKIKNENIIFGFGSYSILERLAWKFLLKGLMIGEFPQFRFFPMEYMLAGGQYQGIWRKDFSFPKQELIKIIRENKNIKVVYINNPNNPTGQVYDKRDITELIKVAESKRIMVIVDEVYGDLLPLSNTLAGSIFRFSNLIVLRSFSKIFGLQNLRLGYMISSQNIIERYKNICNWNEITNINALLALSVLKNKKYLNALRVVCRRMKKRTEGILRKRGFKIIPGSPLVPIMFVQYPKNINLGEYFRKKNIKVEGSSKFTVLYPNFPRNYARLRIPFDDAKLNVLRRKLCKL